MTIEVLIQAIVRQTTVLIAQLATSWGSRAPLAQVASQVFLNLVSELEAQGVSRKVSADMFGLGLRTYQRKIQRLTESSTERGRSLWEAVLTYLREKKMTTRADIRERFSGDEEVQIRGVLRDLCDSGLVFYSGHGSGAVYRAASEDELGALRRFRTEEGLDRNPLGARVPRGSAHRRTTRLAGAPERSRGSSGGRALGRIEAHRIGRREHAARLPHRFVPHPVELADRMGSGHFRSLPGHGEDHLLSPAQRWSIARHRGRKHLYARHLARAPARGRGQRDALPASRYHRRLEKAGREFNADHPPPERHTQLVLYVGQCLIQEGQEESS